MKPTIDHLIAFYPCIDLDLQHAFYHDKLGLNQLLDQGSCRIYGITGGASVGFCTGLKPVTPSDQLIITIVTPQVEAWHLFLTQNRVPIDGNPRINERFQIYHFYARDPAGYRVEFQEFLDPRWNS